MLAGVSFPLILFFALNETNPILISFSVAISLLLIITHRKNIKRLLNKQESKVSLFKSQSAD